MWLAFRFRPMWWLVLLPVAISAVIGLWIGFDLAPTCVVRYGAPPWPSSAPPPVPRLR